VLVAATERLASTGSVYVQFADVRDAASVDSGSREIIRSLCKADIPINNAGITGSKQDNLGLHAR
jgi:NADP-dependent 3-hydroxy acid dehydrogenase YdfG